MYVCIGLRTMAPDPQNLCSSMSPRFVRRVPRTPSPLVTIRRSPSPSHSRTRSETVEWTDREGWLREEIRVLKASLARKAAKLAALAEELEELTESNFYQRRIVWVPADPPIAGRGFTQNTLRYEGCPCVWCRNHNQRNYAERFYRPRPLRGMR